MIEIENTEYYFILDINEPRENVLEFKLVCGFVQKEKEQLKSLLLKSPKDYGFFTWDKWSIKSLIKQEFGVDYHENYIWYLMKCINYSSQKPQIKDYRKNAKKVANFKEKEAVVIKKSRI